jgi:hypothetical protein
MTSSIPSSNDSTFRVLGHTDTTDNGRGKGENCMKRVKSAIRLMED